MHVLSVLAASAVVSSAPVEQLTLAELEEAGDIFIRGFIAEGSGCRTLGEPLIAGNSITFLLQNYSASREGNGASARVDCNIAVEVDLAPGLNVSLDRVIYKGYAEGFKGSGRRSLAQTQFSRSYFLAGNPESDFRATIIKWRDFDDIISIKEERPRGTFGTFDIAFNEFTAQDLVATFAQPRCGQPSVWRANTSLTARSRGTDSYAVIQIDTVDVANEFFVTFNFGSLERCI